MTSLIGKLSENPSLANIEEQEKINKTNEIIKEAKKNITTEEFEKMSWADLRKNIRVSSDGSLTLFSKSISYWLLYADWNDEQLDGYEEFKEEYKKNQEIILQQAQKQIKQKILLNNVLIIWEKEARKQVASVWFKSFRKDDDNILENIKKINSLLQIGVPISQEILDNNFNEIFGLMQLSERQESIVGEDDLIEIRDIFFDSSIDDKTKKIKIFNLMRYGGLSGNSEGVKDVVADELLQTQQFKKESEILQNPKFLEYLEDENFSKLKEFLGEAKAKKLQEIYEKTESKLEEEFKKYLGRENEKKQKSGEKLLNLDEFKKLHKFKMQVLGITKNAFKHYLIYTKLDNKISRGKEDTFAGTYANIVGLAETKGIGDYFVSSDENIDNVIDFGVTLAIGAMTMGAGIGLTMLTKGAITARRLNTASKLGRFFEGGSNILKVGKYNEIVVGGKVIAKEGYVGHLIGNSILDGIAFHEGATIMQNILFKDIENWGDGLTDSHAIIKSIAFMGGLNSLKFISKIKGLSPIMNYEMKIPKDYLNPTVFKKILYGTGNFGIKGVRDGTIMFGISGAIEEYIGNGWNPSVREYLNFVALIQLMHLKDITFKKTLK